MSKDESGISIPFFDSQCNYSKNDESRDSSIVDINEEETSAFPEIQEEDSTEESRQNSVYETISANKLLSIIKLN